MKWGNTFADCLATQKILELGEQQQIPSRDKVTSNRVPTASIYRHCKELQCRQRTLIKLCQEAIIWRDWGQWLKGQQNSHKSHSISLASRLDLRVKIECRIFTLQIPFHLAPECEGSKFQALKLQSINQQWHDGGALHKISCHPWMQVVETASFQLLELLKQSLVPSFYICVPLLFSYLFYSKSTAQRLYCYY